ncbi:MAG: hypothetical protein ACTS73_01540 [Arsenophonus sp. NEOnobi-MAG3]
MLNAPCRLTGVHTIPSSVTVIFHSELYRLVLSMLRLKYLMSWDGSSNQICFNSSLLVPYLKRAKC